MTEKLEISVELDADGNVVEAHNASDALIEATKDLLASLQACDLEDEENDEE